jgi:PKD domain
MRVIVIVGCVAGLLSVAGCGVLGGPTPPPPPLVKAPPVVRNFSVRTSDGGFYGPEEGGDEWTVYASAPGQGIWFSGQVETDGRFPTTLNWELPGFSPSSLSSELYSEVFAMAATPGVYPGSLTATNAYGSHTFHFTTTVVLPPAPVLIDQSDRNEFPVGARISFAPNFAESPDWTRGITYNAHWDFGGGTVESSSSELFATTTAGSVTGYYRATLTVTNAGGSATQVVNYHVY